MAKSTVSLPAPLEKIQRKWGTVNEDRAKAAAVEEVLAAFISRDE